MRSRLPRRRKFVQMAQLDVQDSGLQRVQTRIAADGLVVVFRLLPVVGYHSDAVGQQIVPRHQRAAIAVTRQGFGGEERGCADVPDGSRPLRRAIRKGISGSQRLGVVFV